MNRIERNGMTLPEVAGEGYDMIRVSEDALDQPDTVSIEDGFPEEVDQMTVAGIDDLTPVDTFLNMQGDRSYVTDI